MESVRTRCVWKTKKCTIKLQTASIKRVFRGWRDFKVLFYTIDALRNYFLAINHGEERTRGVQTRSLSLQDECRSVTLCCPLSNVLILWVLLGRGVLYRAKAANSQRAFPPAICWSVCLSVEEFWVSAFGEATDKSLVSCCLVYSVVWTEVRIHSVHNAHR